MLKRALRVLSLLLLVIPGPAFAYGTIPLSMTQQLDQYGKPLTGCLLYTYQAGTTATPQNAYIDTALTLPQPNPMICDSSGRLPQFFLADGLIKISLQDKFGNPQVVLDNVLVIGPSSGSSSGGLVDPTTIAQTGVIWPFYGTGTVTGWVRMNGRTIGSSTSGATERANADTQALFQYLWLADPNLAVSGGRGASSIADWNANKTIALPSAQNRALAGLGDMGNTDAALFAGTPFTSGNSTTLGSRLGIGTPLALGRTDLPNASLTLAGTPQTWSTNQTSVPFNTNNFSMGTGAGGSPIFVPQSNGSSYSQLTVTITPNGTVSLNGGVTQTTPTTVSPLLLVTMYLKL